MSASDEIKERIVHEFTCSNVSTVERDWKRVQKFQLNGETVREFFNSKLNRTVYTIGDDEDCSVYELDQWVYGFCEDEDGGLAVAFEPKDRWNRTCYIYDQHQQFMLEFFHCLPAGQFDEVTENTFIFDDTNPLKLHILLAKYGFKHDQTLTDFLNNTGNRPAPQTPTAPVNPPLPPALDPNWSPPGNKVPHQPASPPSPQSAGGVRIANKSPGQQSQSHTQNQQAMMAQIGQMAAQLGATGGVQIGSLHIPAASLPPGMQPLAGTAPLPPSGIFNSPGMQAAMPMMAGQYPELVNLQPAVQAAFIAQRIMKQQGLVQENPNWMDKAEVENLLLRHRNTSFDLDIERSNAIWMLYELADDGSGESLPDFFAMCDEEISDHLEEFGILDQADDAHNVEIVPDYQNYSAPYDLPVPQPAPMAPPPTQQRPTPMVGPAGINARAGSFTPLQAATPPAATPAAPPPGNVAAHIANDSGDKWAEFCGEVWETFELNRANLPLDIDWYDRYRPRDAQITGLGYSFERREFTGIRVKMGYLDRDGKLIENIDLPSAMLDELLKEWGGSWNVDDITQEIDKRKGENPETGFSYTSEQLWEEVEAFLINEGWKEAK